MLHKDMAQEEKNELPSTPLIIINEQNHNTTRYTAVLALPHDQIAVGYENGYIGIFSALNGNFIHGFINKGKNIFDMQRPIQRLLLNGEGHLVSFHSNMSGREFHLTEWDIEKGSVCHTNYFPYQQSEKTYIPRFEQVPNSTYLIIKGVNEFVTYKNPDAIVKDAHALSSNRILGIVAFHSSGSDYFFNEKTPHRLFLMDKQQRKFVHDKDIFSMAVLKDGKIILGEEKGITVWDPTTSFDKRQYILAYNPDEVAYALSVISPEKIAMGHKNGKISVINIAPGKLRGQHLAIFPAMVGKESSREMDSVFRCLAPLPDQKLMCLSASSFCSDLLTIWDMKNKKVESQTTDVSGLRNYGTEKNVYSLYPQLFTLFPKGRGVLIKGNGTQLALCDFSIKKLEATISLVESGLSSFSKPIATKPTTNDNASYVPAPPSAKYQ